MKLKVENIVHETKDAVSIYLKNNILFNKIKYKPGQFLTLCFEINGQVEKRAYSFSSSPYLDKFLRVTIKRVEKGLVSNHVYNNVKVGDKITIEHPKGSFYHEPEKGAIHKYVMFAGGSGITPVLSIIRTIIEKEPLSSIILFYANRDPSAVIFKDDIDRLEKDHGDVLKVIHILERKGNGSIVGAYEGNLRTEVVDEIIEKAGVEYRNCKYYMCGPLGYMDKVKEILTGKGVEKKYIKMELFTAPKVKFSGEEIMSEVSIIMKGQTTTLRMPGNKTILQSALSNNFPIPYSCKSGMCSTCKGKCVDGEVSMSEGHFLSDREVNEGYVLNCISYPVSDKVTIEIG